MAEKGGEFLKQISVEFKWKHPNNGCPMQQIQPTITQTFTATGTSEAEARRYARVLAENTPQYCDQCRGNYALQ